MQRGQTWTALLGLHSALGGVIEPPWSISTSGRRALACYLPVAKLPSRPNQPPQGSTKLCIIPPCVRPAWPSQSLPAVAQARTCHTGFVWRHASELDASTCIRPQHLHRMNLQHSKNRQSLRVPSTVGEAAPPHNPTRGSRERSLLDCHGPSAFVLSQTHVQTSMFRTVQSSAAFLVSEPTLYTCSPCS